MDDKLKHALSASIDEDPAASERLIANDRQARDYFTGLVQIDAMLRRWPHSNDADGSSALQAILSRLDTADDSFDALALPFTDETATTTSPQREQRAMSQSSDQDNDDDLEGLAALMRPSRPGSSASLPPTPMSIRPGPALADDAMDESSGIVDIKHLSAIAKRTSVPPATAPIVTPAAEKPTAAAKTTESGAKPSSATKPSASASKETEKAAEKAEKSEAKAAQAVPASATIAAAPAPAAAKKATNPIVWMLGMAATLGIGVYFGRGNTPSADAVNGERAPAASVAPTAESSGAAPSTTPVLAAAPVQAAPVAAEPVAAPTPTAEAPAPPPVPTAPQATEAAAVTPQIGGADRGTQAAPEAMPANPPAGVVAGNSLSNSEGTASTRTASARRTVTTATTGTTSATATRGGAPEPTSAPSAPTVRPAAPAVVAAPAPVPPTTAAPTNSAPASVADLMRRAVGPDPNVRRAEDQQSAQAALPPQLTRSMVQSTMNPFTSAVRACAQGQTGTATAVMQVAGSGAVENVTVSSAFGSGPNECITTRLRTAHFPATQRASSRIIYPFSLNPPQPGG
ncbi:MAG: hypothetical protein Q8Q09_12550 [Deltaproteobacteria bacterium]|nr:hypothetical protein [Deltaproteobacteria bacterium]